MRRITTPALAFAAGCLTLASAVLATPLPDGAVLHLRVFNDCPVSVLNTTNSFPGSIVIDDQNSVAPFCVGFANLHTWHFTAGGVDSVFSNGDAFGYSCTLVLNGVGEGGLSLSPWFSPNADGLFNCRTTDGEIACFGGRLPFFTFTGAFGLHYVNNTPIQLGITYVPNGLSSVSPAQILYTVRYNSINYSSGLLDFNDGFNPTDPAYHFAGGTFGALTPWYAGGHMKMFLPTGVPHGITGTWSDIQFTTAPVSTAKTTWGKLKQLYR